jgi:tetratricopeptide (TPR) repeat protein/4-amino-4-deoxy-L-arabinose transferase-like glycosyltransferase
MSSPRLRSADLRTACLVALAAGVLALPFLAGISMLDEGTLVHIADRIASGEVLYRDVATGVMPAAYYLQALLFFVFGRSLLVGRLFMILLFALASAGVFLTARSVTSRAVALSTALSFSALSVSHWRFPSYASEAIFLVFLTLAAARFFLTTRRRKWLFLTGLGLGITILFKQNYGAFVSLGVAVGLVAGAPDARRGLRDVATAAVVAALPIAVTAALFASAGAAADFWYFTVRVPLQIPFTIFARPWPPLWGEPDARLLRDIVYYLPFEELALELNEWLWRHRWLPVAIVRVTYSLPLLFLLAAVFAWLREASRRRKATEFSGGTRDLAAGALYLGTSIFLLLGVFPRVDTHHLMLALAPCFLLAAWLAGPEPRPLVRRGALAAAGFLFTLSLVSQAAVIADTYPEERRDAFLDLPRARVWAERWQVAEIRRQIEQVEKRVPAGEPIFVAPAVPMYYFLADRPNPSRYPLILPGALDEEEVVRTLQNAPVRYALISDTAFENYPFPYVAPRVWDYLIRHFRPADGAGWEVAPHEPYLYSRGSRRKRDPIELLTLEPSENAVERPDGAVWSVSTDYAGWNEVLSLVQPPLSPAIFQAVAVDDWHDDNPDLVQWQSTYLEPGLVVRAPGGWRKVLVSWEIPFEKGYGFEFACAILPWAWSGWVEGQGALVEVWVSSSPEITPPRRVWRRWLNPRRVPEDRRWHRAAVDLSSFVETRKAVVTLVVGSAPTFLATDAAVAWSDLRLIVPAKASTAFDSRRAEARNILLGEGTARAMLYFPEEDLPVFREAVSQYPDLANAHAALSEVATSLGDYELALAASEDAVRLDPEQHHYWMRLGQELQRAGRLAEAIKAMRVALEKAPGNSNYHAALASALLGEASGLEKARSAALEAIRLDAGNAWAFALLASVERKKGDHEAAARAAERSVALEPTSAWPYLALAESLQAMGRTSEALPILERAASLDMLDRDPAARSVLARNLLACGRPERAREEALAATEQDPRSAESWTVLAQVESTLERWEPAVRAWREAAALDPDNSSLLVHLGRALVKSGRGEEALDALLAARTLAEGDASRLREVAIVLDELGRPDESLPTWRSLRRLAPEGELKEEARRRLGFTPRPE